MAGCVDDVGGTQEVIRETDGSENMFDVEAYCSQYCSLDPSTADPFEVPSLKSRMKIIHDYYQLIGLKDARVLEYGSGPSVYSLIGAVPYCREIVISEYDVRSRDFLSKWKNGQANHHITTLFQYAVMSIEKLGEGDEVSQRENALRQLISGIYPGDLNTDTPIEMDSPGLFDIISTHFTCHTVCMSVDEFRAAVGRLVKFLKPGGFLILSEILECELGKWDGLKVGYKGFQLTRESLIECIEQLGFINIKDDVVAEEPIDGKAPPEFGKTLTLLAQAP
ncbi:indolethylamine N-methyltransferase-like [Corticium candelabrum]|uniref:indolethylamine N-methyltransferase-like n=1 Tax=Corticium candelabrum TaxID=121492 RepID=UPI002E26B40A|nr:indolethylamine N-methyltransferase-like [Corticium candelabrum]